MTMYVDQLKKYNGKYWCHMMTDGDLKELHQFALSIGLKRSWFQNRIYHPHYDLVPSKRNLAIQKGAKSVDGKTMIEKCSPERFKQLMGDSSI